MGGAGGRRGGGRGGLGFCWRKGGRGGVLGVCVCVSVSVSVSLLAATCLHTRAAF